MLDRGDPHNFNDDRNLHNSSHHTKSKANSTIVLLFIQNISKFFLK